MAARTALKHRPEARDGIILAEAVRRIAEYWQLTNEGLGDVLGLSGSTVSRLRNGAWQFQAGSKSFELAQYLVRLFRSLDSLMGSDDAASRSWLQAENPELGARPLDLIMSIRGLMTVADYVDDYRAHV
ncbi:MAG TPA: MbcA/ParS/Xre antitoxin family protein [Sphingomicrobium sp.]|jgi:uncharacterized protein (DUF2384 family)|nr:MbcA/ParS/Xre antitoxin family protein [Sphingomicrobium sp.]